MKVLQAFAIVLKCLPVVLLGGCSALQLVNSVSKIYTVEVKTDLAFGDHPKQRYDLYLPNAAQAPGRDTPVIIFFYGGSWNRGDKTEYEFVGRRLASLGYITAIPNYRLYPEVRYPEFLEDGAHSIATIQRELAAPDYAHLQPAKQFVLMGHSAGAYNAAMLAYDPRWLVAAGGSPSSIGGFVGLAGAYNIYPIRDLEVQPVFNHPNYPEASQPIEFVSNARTPSLILAPEQDTIVSIERNSLALHKAIQAAGKESE
ncbi:MAG TPA: alpha/beta hydrolase, partial [Limnobacter sp.]|nr:alpha/beta hydrolase [Limnobacter sp.]